MTRCEDIEAAVEAGESPRGPEARAHIADCPSCHALLDDDVLPPLPGPADVDGIDVAALFERVERDVAKERGVVAYLRARPTWQRRVLLVSAALAVPIGAVAAKGADLASPWAIAATSAAVLLAVALLIASLRPLHRPAWPSWLDRLLLGLALGLPVLVALTATAGAGQTGGGAVGCFGMGLVVGSPALAVAWVISRGRTLTASLFGASGASLAAFVSLHAICGSTHPEHLLLGHATVVWATVLAVSATIAARARAR